VAERPPGPPAAPAAWPVAAIAGLLFNAGVWGVSWLPFRLLDRLGLHSLWTTALMFALGTVVVLAARPRAAREVAGDPWMWALAVAAGLTNACFNWAVSTGSVVRVVLLFYLMPVWALGLARWLLAERIGRDGLARVALAIAGAAVVLWRPDAGMPWPRELPDWLALAGGACFAMTNVLLRRRADASAPARSLAMFVGGTATAGGLAVLLAATTPLLRVPDWQHPAWLPGALVLAAVFLAANLALQYGAARLPAGVTAVVMLTEVLFATVSAMLLGDESPGLRVLLGGALILSATVLAIVRRDAGSGPDGDGVAEAAAHSGTDRPRQEPR
jgi:drug/metabolite transporter (DMT)-like permease